MIIDVNGNWLIIPQGPEYLLFNKRKLVQILNNPQYKEFLLQNKGWFNIPETGVESLKNLGSSISVGYSSEPCLKATYQDLLDGKVVKLSYGIENEQYRRFILQIIKEGNLFWVGAPDYGIFYQWLMAEEFFDHLGFNQNLRVAASSVMKGPELFEKGLQVNYFHVDDDFEIIIK